MHISRLGAIVLLLGPVMGCQSGGDAVRLNRVLGLPSQAVVYTVWPFDAAEADRRQAETAKTLGLPRELALDLGCKVRITLALVPAGEFMMGSPKGEGWDNERLHRVRITEPFYIGTCPVTQGQYRVVMGKYPISYQHPDNPVVWVSWHEAVEFCVRMSAKTGRTVQLPTEAQWEYACRAGTATPFHTGKTISADQANYKGDEVYGDGVKGEYRYKLTPVGSFKPNAWGLFDMHGNVWEWCSDWHGEYQAGPVTDPPGFAFGESRVLRGGSWHDPPRTIRSALRGLAAPDRTGGEIGFRVIATVCDVD